MANSTWRQARFHNNLSKTSALRETISVNLTSAIQDVITTGRLAQWLALVGAVVCAGCSNTPVAPTPPKPIVTPTPTPAAAGVLSAIRGAVADQIVKRARCDARNHQLVLTRK